MTVATIVFTMASVLVYMFLTRKIPGADVNMVAREIETTDKMWLNGYLGHFFRLNYFTLFNWLLIPILVYDFFKIKRATVSKKVFLFVYLFCLILIGAKGYFNSRYSLSLYPVSIAYMLIWLSQFLKTKKLTVIFKTIPYIIIALSFLWFAREIFVWKTKHETEQYNKVTYNNAAGFNQIETTPKPFFLKRFIGAIVKDEYPNYNIGKNKNQNYKWFPQFDIYDDVVRAVDLTGTKVLVNNMPAIFYHTNINGVYYWAGDDLIFDGNGKYHLFEGRTPEEVRHFLKYDLQVDYIFTSETYNRYLPAFHEFLQNNCILLKEGKLSYQLFKIN